MRALETLYYDNERKREGDVFTISDARFKAGEKKPGYRKVGDLKELSKSMEIIDRSAPNKTTGSQAALNRELHKVELEKAGMAPANPLGD